MSATPDTARAFRDAAIRRAIGGTLGARAVSVTCTLLQVPIALSYLGKEAYGLWVALTSATLLLNVADFGLGAGMQNEVGTSLGRGNVARARQLFATAALLLAAVAVLLALLGIPVAARIPWAKLFHLADPALAISAGPAAVATVVLFAAGLPFTAAARLANACQWGWMAGAWAALASVAQLAIVVIASRAHLGFVTFVWCAGAAPLLATVGLLAHVLRRLGWSPWPLQLAPAADRRALVRTGLDFSLLQVGATFVYNAAAPAIGAFAGAPAVAAYNVLQRLLGLAPQLQQIAIAPTWPAYTDAAARGDRAWVRRTYRRALVATIVGVGVPVALTAAFAPTIVRLWARSDTLPLSASLVWAVAGWNFLLCLGHVPTHLLGGLGCVRRLTAWAVAGNVVSAGAIVALGHAWGAAGVVSGLLAGHLLLGVPGALREALLALRAVPEPLHAS